MIMRLLSWQCLLLVLTVLISNIEGSRSKSRAKSNDLEALDGDIGYYEQPRLTSQQQSRFWNNPLHLRNEAATSESASGNKQTKSASEYLTEVNQIEDFLRSKISTNPSGRSGSQQSQLSPDESDKIKSLLNEVKSVKRSLVDVIQSTNDADLDLGPQQRVRKLSSRQHYTQDEIDEIKRRRTLSRVLELLRKLKAPSSGSGLKVPVVRRRRPLIEDFGDEVKATTEVPVATVSASIGDSLGKKFPIPNRNELADLSRFDALQAVKGPTTEYSVVSGDRILPPRIKELVVPPKVATSDLNENVSNNVQLPVVVTTPEPLSSSGKDDVVAETVPVVVQQQPQLEPVEKVEKVALPQSEVQRLLTILEPPTLTQLKEENSNRLPSESPINQPSADVLPSLNIPTVNEEISQPKESPTITTQLQDSKPALVENSFNLVPSSIVVQTQPQSKPEAAEVNKEEIVEKPRNVDEIEIERPKSPPPQYIPYPTFVLPSEPVSVTPESSRQQEIVEETPKIVNPETSNISPLPNIIDYVPETTTESPLVVVEANRPISVPAYVEYPQSVLSNILLPAENQPVVVEPATTNEILLPSKSLDESVVSTSTSPIPLEIVKTKPEEPIVDNQKPVEIQQQDPVVVQISESPITPQSQPQQQETPVIVEPAVVKVVESQPVIVEEASKTATSNVGDEKLILEIKQPQIQQPIESSTGTNGGDRVVTISESLLKEILDRNVKSSERVVEDSAASVTITPPPTSSIVATVKEAEVPITPPELQIDSIMDSPTTTTTTPTPPQTEEIKTIENLVKVAEAIEKTDEPALDTYLIEIIDTIEKHLKDLTSKSAPHISTENDDNHHELVENYMKLRNQKRRSQKESIKSLKRRLSPKKLVTSSGGNNGRLSLLRHLRRLEPENEWLIPSSDRKIDVLKKTVDYLKKLSGERSKKRREEKIRSLMNRDKTSSLMKFLRSLKSDVRPLSAASILDDQPSLHLTSLLTNFNSDMEKFSTALDEDVLGESTLDLVSWEGQHRVVHVDKVDNVADEEVQTLRASFVDTPDKSGRDVDAFKFAQVEKSRVLNQDERDMFEDFMKVDSTRTYSVNGVDEAKIIN